jgi:predicted acyltransferase
MSTATPAAGGAVLPGRLAPPAARAEAAERGTGHALGSRVVSVDVCRGVVIAGMLLVNNLVWTSGTPGQLMHAAWGQGVTFTDMILPWFVFIIGVTIPLAAGTGRSGPARALRALRRAALLIALGIAIDSLQFHGLTVGMDVLQLLGLSYLTAVVLAQTPVWMRLLASGVLFAGYAALLERVAAPGYPAGLLDPHHNIVQYLNDARLARYDLAGVLAVAPATALALIGTAAGDVLRHARLPERLKIGALAAAGAGLVAGGLWWGRALPLIKDLWTPSYAIAAGGAGLLVLAGCHLLCRSATGRAAGLPFAVLGANAIVAYVASALLAIGLQFYTWPDPWTRGHTLSLHSTVLDPLGRAVGQAPAAWLFTGAVVGWWWLVLWILYRRRVFIRV